MDRKDLELSNLSVFSQLTDMLRKGYSELNETKLAEIRSNHNQRNKSDNENAKLLVDSR